MTGSEQNTAPKDDEIDLREQFRVVWAGKWLLIGCTLLASIISIAVAVSLPNIYRAEALLAPSSAGGAGGLSALAAQYGDLASLAGINLGDVSDTDQTEFGLAVLKSRKFASGFIERHDILVPLMAAEDWNVKTGELEIDSSVYDEASETWVRDVKPPRTTIPSLHEASEVFQEQLMVNRDTETGFVGVAFEYYSPEIASQWLDWLIEDLNETVMREDIAEAERAIDYLTKQISNTSLADMRSVFFALIEEQTKTIMLAKVSDEYLLKTIDPAVAPDEKVRPYRSVIVVLSTLLGGFIGVLLVFMRYGSR